MLGELVTVYTKRHEENGERNRIGECQSVTEQFFRSVCKRKGDEK